MKERPVLDGMQTTKLIRSKYPDSHTHITSMTAGVFPGIITLIIILMNNYYNNFFINYFLKRIERIVWTLA